MIARGVAVGQVRINPDGCRFRVTEVFEERLYDTPRCSVVPTKDPQPRIVYRATYSVETVRKWKLA